MIKIMKNPSVIDRNELIKKAFNEGKGYTQIAKLFNISRQRVYQVVQGNRANLDHLFKAIIQRDDNKCTLCKCSWRFVLNQGEMLLVHHIDHNPSNNNPDNLITLCGKCHRDYHGKSLSVRRHEKNIANGHKKVFTLIAERHNTHP